jgi:hypothetical protein
MEGVNKLQSLYPESPAARRGPVQDKDSSPLRKLGTGQTPW